MSGDVWVGAVTTLAGGLLGGAISFIVSRQQARDARRQRAEDDVREQRRRSEDRRYAVYSDFLTQARSFRNAVEAYYAHPRGKPAVTEIGSLLQNANDASALVFLVVESQETYEGCRLVLRALSRAGALLHEKNPAADPWDELNLLLGQAIREFQNAARGELGVSGPTVPWRHEAPGPGAVSPLAGAFAGVPPAAPAAGTRRQREEARAAPASPQPGRRAAGRVRTCRASHHCRADRRPAPGAGAAAGA